MWLRGVPGRWPLADKVQIPVLSQGLFAGTGATWVASQAVDNGLPGSLPGEERILEFCCFVSAVPALPKLLVLMPSLQTQALGTHPSCFLFPATVCAWHVSWPSRYGP